MAVDGVTSSGKTTLAGEAAGALTALGRPVIRLSMDGYHYPREHRYRQGRTSPDGYYKDAYDFDAFARQYHRRVIHLASDTAVRNDIAVAAPDAVLLVDGSFLQRPEIIELWDCRIYADTSLAVARQRGVARDAAPFGGAAEADRLYEIRYHAAAARYLAEVRPAERAHLRVQNDNLASPTLVNQRPFR